MKGLLLSYKIVIIILIFTLSIFMTLVELRCQTLEDLIYFGFV